MFWQSSDGTADAAAWPWPPLELHSGPAALRLLPSGDSEFPSGHAAALAVAVLTPLPLVPVPMPPVPVAADSC